MVISLYLEKWRPHLAVRWKHPRTTMINEHYFGSIQTSLHAFAFLLCSTFFSLRKSLRISHVSEGSERTPGTAPRGVWPGPGPGPGRVSQRLRHLAAPCTATLWVINWAGGLIFKFVFLLFVFGRFEEKNVPFTA